MAQITRRSDFPTYMIARNLNTLRSEVWGSESTVSDMIGPAYNRGTGTGAFYQDHGLVGLPNARLKPEATGVQFFSPRYDRPFVMVYPTYAIGTGISEEAQEDDVDDIVVPYMMRELRRAIEYTQQVDAASLYNDGFTLMGYEIDGAPMFSDQHYIIGSGTYGTNRIPGDAALSQSALDSAVFILRTTLNETGRLMDMDNGFELHVPPALGQYALVLTSTAKAIGSNWNDKNLYNGISVVINPFLTSNTAWFVQTKQHKWMWKDRKKPKTVTQVDTINGYTLMVNKARWGKGASDWRGKIGSRGPG